VLCSFISPFRAERRMVRELVGDGEFVEIHVDTPLEVCKQRDPKGLYARAMEGKIKNFTGIDSPYEPPEKAEIVVDTSKGSAEDVAAHIVAALREKQIIS
jgi:bifunctional enzyme CysN/CysC